MGNMIIIAILLTVVSCIVTYLYKTKKEERLVLDAHMERNAQDIAIPIRTSKKMYLASSTQSD